MSHPPGGLAAPAVSAPSSAPSAVDDDDDGFLPTSAFMRPPFHPLVAARADAVLTYLDELPPVELAVLRHLLHGHAARAEYINRLLPHVMEGCMPDSDAPHPDQFPLEMLVADPPVRTADQELSLSVARVLTRGAPRVADSPPPAGTLAATVAAPSGSASLSGPPAKRQRQSSTASAYFLPSASSSRPRTPSPDRAWSSFELRRALRDELLLDHVRLLSVAERAALRVLLRTSADQVNYLNSLLPFVLDPAGPRAVPEELDVTTTMEDGQLVRDFRSLLTVVHGVPDLPVPRPASPPAPRLGGHSAAGVWAWEYAGRPLPCSFPAHPRSSAAGSASSSSAAAAASSR